jgi:signal transduction histidine kinase/CheY-like chemotaxis protein
MATRSIFENFVSSQGYSLFEALGNGEFRPIGDWPEWCTKAWGAEPTAGATIRLGDKSAFLENFLFDAEDFWKANSSGSINSGNWIEQGDSGEAIPLEASAVSLAGQRILIVRNLGPAYTEQQEMYQTARDSLLSHEKLLREILKKEILLHCIVHDLSQPLSAMAGTFHLLSLEPLTPQLKKYVKSGEREAQRQEMMIRGILEAFSSDLAAQHAVSSEPQDAPDLVQSAKQSIQSFEPAFRDHGIKLQLDPSVKTAANWGVTGESSRLERIFGNLLENALRYSPKGSTVRINVEDQGDFVRASVNDEGPGLPTDKPQSQLFALFARGKAHAGKAGLGLYFCKISVERWGGSIGAETRPEGGSRFWFRLPRASGAAAAVGTAATGDSKSDATQGKFHTASKHAERAKAAKPLRVLVADDADLNRELVIELLEKHGHTAVGVSDGKKVLAALEREYFDAVLMDEEMPHMTGVAATLEIRAREKGGTKHQFIIGLTGNATAEDERRMLEAGMDAFLTKPIHMQKLYQTVALAGLRWDTASDPATPAPPTIAPLAVNVVTAPPASDPLSAPDEPLDVRGQLDRMTGGNEKLARSLVKAFLADAPKALTQIRSALQTKQAERLAAAAHLLKGSLSIFGATKAVAAARNLQNIGRSGSLAKAAGELHNLEAAFAELVSELASLYPTAAKKSKLASATKNGAAPKTGTRTAAKKDATPKRKPYRS